MWAQRQRGGSSSAVYTSLSFAVRARSALSARRNNQVAATDGSQLNGEDLRELQQFQAHVADHLRRLGHTAKADAPQQGPQHERRDAPPVSLCFLRKMLDAFVSIEEEFKALLLPALAGEPAHATDHPLDRLVADLLERVVKCLDVLNAVTGALDSLRFAQKHVEIAAAALGPLSSDEDVGEAQFQRARRAAAKLLAFLAPEQYAGVAAAERVRSSSRSGDGSLALSTSSRRCLVLDVSPTWSAVKQLRAMCSSLVTPRGADPATLSMAVHTMSSVITFMVWILLLAFPGKDRGGHCSTAVAVAVAATSIPSPPRQLPWAEPMTTLQERIAEDARRRDRMGPSGAATPPPVGLLAELQSMETCARALVRLGGGAPELPLSERQREEVEVTSLELAATSRSMEEELEGIQQRVRKIFHRMLISRAEVLDRVRRTEVQTAAGNTPRPATVHAAF